MKRAWLVLPVVLAGTVFGQGGGGFGGPGGGAAPATKPASGDKGPEAGPGGAGQGGGGLGGGGFSGAGHGGGGGDLPGKPVEGAGAGGGFGGAGQGTGGRGGRMGGRGQGGPGQRGGGILGGGGGGGGEGGGIGGGFGGGDVPGGKAPDSSMVKVVPLRSTQAELVAKTLKEVIGTDPGRSIAVDARTNTLVLRGDDAFLKQIVELVEVLDQSDEHRKRASGKTRRYMVRILWLGPADGDERDERMTRSDLAPVADELHELHGVHFRVMASWLAPVLVPVDGEKGPEDVRTDHVEINGDSIRVETTLQVTGELEGNTDSPPKNFEVSIGMTGMQIDNQQNRMSFQNQVRVSTGEFVVLSVSPSGNQPQAFVIQVRPEIRFKSTDGSAGGGSGAAVKGVPKAEKPAAPKAGPSADAKQASAEKGTAAESLLLFPGSVGARAKV